jgi:hypothetical protein
MNSDDFFRELTRSPGHAALSSSDLEDLAKRASSMFLTQDTPLTEAVVKIAQECRGISSEQVKRVVEMANQNTFQQLFEKNAGDRNVHFDIADPNDVLRILNTGASAPVVKVASQDYASRPADSRHKEIAADLALCAAFGVYPQATPAMDKTAVIDPARGQAALQLFARNEQAAKAQKKVIETLMQPPPVAPPPSPEQLGIEGMTGGGQPPPKPMSGLPGMGNMGMPSMPKMGAAEGKSSKREQAAALVGLPFAGAGLGAGLGGLGALYRNMPVGPAAKRMAAGGAMVGGAAAGLVGLGALLNKADPTGKSIEAIGALLPAVATTAGMVAEVGRADRAYGEIGKGKRAFAEIIKTAGDMPPFLEQDRPEKVKDIYSALKRDHPEYSAGKKARIASSKAKEAMAYIKTGQPDADLVGNDLEEYVSTDAIKTAARENEVQYPEAHPFGDLVRAHQWLTKQAEDLRSAIEENDFHLKEAYADLAHRTTQHVLEGGDMGEIVHLLSGMGSEDQVKEAMQHVIPELERRLPPWQFTNLEAGLISYEMEKGASVRAGNPDHPIASAFAGVIKLSKDAETLKVAEDGVSAEVNQATDTIRQAIPNANKAGPPAPVGPTGPMSGPTGPMSGL